MKPTPRKQKCHPLDVLTICAAVSAVVWMALILLRQSVILAHIAAACFIVFAVASSLLYFRVQSDAPPSEEAPAPLPSLRSFIKADRYCPACGAPLRKNDRFCAKCGGRTE